MRYKGSIKKRLIFIMMSVTLLTALIGYSSFVYWYMQNQYKRALDLSKTVSLVLGQDFAKLILLNEVAAAADISTSLKPFLNLEKLTLYNLKAKPVLQYSKDGHSFTPEVLPKKENRISKINGNILKLYIDAKYEESHLGYVQIKLKIDTISMVIQKNIGIAILILSFMFLISYLLTIYFAKKFTEPILDLVSFLEKVELTDSLNRRVNTNEQNEYGKLYDEVNFMLKRLESSHKALKLAAIAFETQTGVTITDKNQKILQVNKSFTDITGYAPVDVVGKTPKILQSGLHDAKFYDRMKKSLEKKKFWSGEIKNRHKDGKIVNEHLTIHSVLDDDKEVLYYVASFIDLTLLKETQEQLREKENMLIQKSKMAAMGEMIENIAHQWKQPLSMISTIASTISLKKEMNIPSSDEEQVEELRKITETVQYLSNTIDDFRGFFKPNKKRDIFELKDCYYKVLNLVKSKINSADIQIIENLDNVKIYSLENELIQVIMNILNNSRDALINSEEQEKLIFVDIYKEENKAILNIKDNAGGIPEDIIGKIFESYFTTKENSGGTGIGLYMSKEIISKHMDGDIEVFNSSFKYGNKEYKGASFKISIPFEK